NFIRRFFEREQFHYQVKSDTFDWQATTGPKRSLRFLPKMQTDVSLVGSDRRLVIEAKFYRRCLQLRHGKATVHSGHLYQLFAYLRNLAVREPTGRVDGLLLYPTVGRRLRLDFEMHGHTVRVRTIDLTLVWERIRKTLLRMADVPMSAVFCP